MPDYVGDCRPREGFLGTALRHRLENSPLLGSGTDIPWDAWRENAGLGR